MPAPYSPCLAIDHARAHLEHRARGADEVRLVGELLDLLVVDDQAVDAARSSASSDVARDVDPQVHRVHARRTAPPCTARARRAGGRAGCWPGTARLGRARGVRELRLEVLEDVEVGLQRVADVRGRARSGRPRRTSCRPATCSMSSVITPRSCRTRVLVLAEVVADRADDARLGEERRGEREVHGGAAEQPVALAGRRLDGVEGDGSDDGERHRGGRVAGSLPPPCARSASASGAGPRCSSSSRTRRCPSPATHEVLVRVTRAGDQLRRHPRARELLPRALRAAADPGRRGGRASTRGRPAQRVVALIGTGGYAEYAAAPDGDARSRSPTASSDGAGARAADPGPDGLAPVPDLRAAAPRARAWSCTRRPAASARSRSSSARPFGAGRVIATASTRGEARSSRSSSAPTPRSTSRARTSPTR